MSNLTICKNGNSLSLKTQSQRVAGHDLSRAQSDPAEHRRRPGEERGPDSERERAGRAAGPGIGHRKRAAAKAQAEAWEGELLNAPRICWGIWELCKDT